LLTVIVEVLPLPPLAEIVVGLNAHVVPAEQARLMAPVNALAPVGPFASMTKVVWVLPMITGLLAVGEVSVKAAAPIPVSATVWGLPVALSLMLNVPFRVLLAVGSKYTYMEQLCPTVRVLATAVQELAAAEV